MSQSILVLSVSLAALVSCQQAQEEEVISREVVTTTTKQPAVNSVYKDSPFRHNPAITREHAVKVDQVRRHLYTGEGYFDLGQYDQARAEFQKVLAIDPYNQAAQRWIDRCPKPRKGPVTGS